MVLVIKLMIIFYFCIFMMNDCVDYSSLMSCLLTLSQDGRTPAHCATRNGHTACLELLLKNGANIEAKDNVRLPSYI